MKTILHVSNFNLLRLKGCFQVGMPIKISNGLIRCGYYVVNYPDRDLCRMFGFGHMNFWSKKKVNDHLIKYCQSIKPDAIILGHADTIKTETILEIRRMFPQIKVLQWSCDWIVPSYAEHNIKVLNDKLPCVDASLITTGDEAMLKQFTKDGKKAGYLPNIADSSIELGRAFENEHNTYDAMLCASTGKRQFCGKDVEIDELVDKAQTQIPDIKWLLAGLKGNSLLGGYDYIQKISSSSMGLNLSRLNNIKYYSSDRMVHIMANGGLAFIDRRSGFNELFGEDTAAFYSEEEEFFDKLKFYHSNPQFRMQTAKNGWEKMHGEFNERIIGQYIADVLFENEIKEHKNWHIMY